MILVNTWFRWCSVSLLFDSMIYDPRLHMIYSYNSVCVSRRMWWQRNIDQYWSGYANDRLHEYLYIAAAFIVPEVLALVLFILPWLRNFVENSNWRIFHALTWWFQVRACHCSHHTWICCPLVCLAVYVQIEKCPNWYKMSGWKFQM